jgi:hypothetical protein
VPTPAKTWGPYSKSTRRPDGRSPTGRLERQVVRELTAHIGGKPTAVQRILIMRAARLVVVIEMLEKQIIESGVVGDHAGRQVLAWHNTLRLVMQSIGIEAPAEDAPTVSEFLAGYERTRAA